MCVEEQKREEKRREEKGVLDLDCRHAHYQHTHMNIDEVEKLSFVCEDEVEDNGNGVD